VKSKCLSRGAEKRDPVPRILRQPQFLAACDGRSTDSWSNEQTSDPYYADDRSFYKVEKWTKDGMRVDSVAVRR
jgi:hypothetical protein